MPGRKVRTKIREKIDEEHESLSVEIKPFRKIFLGRIAGVVLRERRGGKNDNHIIFEMINEDDGYWFPGDPIASSYWFDDYIAVLSAAKKWCEKNCDAEICDGQPCGWKFKK
jgi:hypothetical protein